MIRAGIRLDMRLDISALAPLFALLFALPARATAQDPPARVATMATIDWTGIQRPDLFRYNRVEGFSLGVRAGVRFGLARAPLSAALTGRLGTADREPRGTLAFTRETLSHALTVSAYRELQLSDPTTRALEPGPSLVALVIGRDDGDYYQAVGAALTWTPPSAQQAPRQAWHRARLYAERQAPVERATQGSLFHLVGWDDGFRAASPAARAYQAGIELTVSRWWSPDPSRPAAGFDVQLQGERGDFDFERARAGLRVALPLPASARLTVAAGGGITEGNAPPQRLWMLGGPASLRGFAPGAASGRNFLSGRAELARPLPGVPAVGIALFADAGWAGRRDQLEWADALASAGIGASLLDGVLRVDGAWGWQGPGGWRVELYLERSR